jgi:hypothetical protein
MGKIKVVQILLNAGADVRIYGDLHYKQPHGWYMKR